MTRSASLVRGFDASTAIAWLVGLALVSTGVGLAARDLATNPWSRDDQKVGLAIGFVVLSAGTLFLTAGVIAGMWQDRRPRLGAAIIIGASTIVAVATVATDFWSADRACQLVEGGKCWPVGTAPVAATLSLVAAWASGFAVSALMARRRSDKQVALADGRPKAAPRVARRAGTTR